MRVLLKVVTNLSIVLTAAAPQLGLADTRIEQICEAKKTYLLEAKKNQTSVDQMVRTVVKGDEDVVFFGVEHGNYEQLLYPKLVELVKEKIPSLNCFFVEESLSEKDEKIISDFNAGVPGTENEIKSRFDYYSDFFVFLRENGIDIHYLDFPGKDDLTLDSRDDILYWLNVRDEYMANKIDELKDTKKCNAALFPIGAAHLVKAKGRTDLKSLLSQKKVKSAEMLLLISGRNSAPADSEHPYPLINLGLIWSNLPLTNNALSPNALLCRANPQLSVAPHAFLNPPSKVPIAYTADIDGFVGTFGEFQGTYIYSCQTEKCNEENRLMEKTLKDQHLTFY